MWAAGLNPYQDLSPSEVSFVSPLFKQYSLYIKAKNLGIKISPNDMDIQTLDSLSTISNAIEDVLERKRKQKRK